MQATAVAARGSRGLAAITAILLAVFVVGGAISIVASSPSGREDAVRLAGITDGVSLQHVGDRALIFVRDGSDVRAFSQVDLRNERVIWCPDIERFTSLRDGSQYAIDGHKVGGPAPGDLAEVALRRADGLVYASTSHQFGTPVSSWSDFLTGQWTSARADTCPPTPFP